MAACLPPLIQKYFHVCIVCEYFFSKYLYPSNSVNNYFICLRIYSYRDCKRIFKRLSIQKMAMPQLKRYPWNLNLIKNVLISVNFSNTINVSTKQQTKINSLTITIYIIHTYSDKAFKGTVFNRTCPSLYEGTVQWFKKADFMDNSS